MKNLFTFFTFLSILFFCTSIGNAQFLIDQNFAGSFPPSGWVKHVGNFPNLGSTTTSSAVTQDDFGNDPAHAHGKAFRINVYGTTINHWLLSPVIDMSATQVNQIQFDIALTNYNASSQGVLGPDDTVLVAYSIDGGTTWSLSQTLQIWTSADNVPNTGAHVSYDLTSIGSQTNVQFAFYGISRVSGGDVDFFFDNVKVGGALPVDMKANQILNPAPFTTLNPTPVQVVYENIGTLASSGWYHAAVYDNGDLLVYRDSVAFTAVAAGAVDTAEFTPFNNTSASGSFKATAWVSAVGDGFAENDSVMHNYIFVKKSSPVAIVYSAANTEERANRDSLMSAMASTGVNYDTLNRDYGAPDMSPWSTVIWADYNSVPANERQAIMNFLDTDTEGGIQKSFIIFGDDIGYFHDREGATDRDTVFMRNYMHTIYYADGTTTASRVCGVAVNPGQCDSINAPWPDAMGVYNGSTVAYRYAFYPANSDSVAGTAYDGAYNVLFFAFEIRDIVGPVTEGVQQIIAGAFSWVENAGGQIPVELAAFTASVNDNEVTLSWSTATETNNSGFSVERKSGEGEFSSIAFVEGYGTTTEKQVYSYTEKVEIGKYVYRLKQIDFDGTYKYSHEVEVDAIAPGKFALEQNYPNPFNPATVIKYSVPRESFVNLSVYNALGEKVAQLVNGINKPGTFEVNFNASKYASGVYFYRLEAGDFISIKKMMMIK